MSQRRVIPFSRVEGPAGVQLHAVVEDVGDGLTAQQQVHQLLHAKTLNQDSRFKIFFIAISTTEWLTPPFTPAVFL